MGTIQHDAVLAIFWEGGACALPSAFTEWRDSLPVEWQRLAIGPIAPVVNGGAIYAWLPDGSKLGWPNSDRGDEYRSQFINIMRGLGSYPNIYWVSVGELGDLLVDVSDPADDEEETP